MRVYDEDDDSLSSRTDDWRWMLPVTQTDVESQGYGDVEQEGRSGAR